MKTSKRAVVIKEFVKTIISALDIGKLTINADIDNYRQFVPNDKSYEIEHFFNNNAGNNIAINEYLVKKEENHYANVYKKILYFLQTPDEISLSLIEENYRSRKTKLIINIFVCLFLGILTEFIFGSNAFSIYDNPKQMLMLIPSTYYGIILLVTFFTIFVACIVFSFSLRGKGIAFGEAEGERLQKKYSLYKADVEDLKKYILLDKRCLNMFLLTIDIMVVGIILLTLLMKSIFQIKYSLCLLVVTVIISILCLLLASALNSMNKKQKKLVDSIYDSLRTI